MTTPAGPDPSLAAQRARRRRLAWLVLILLVAAGLRLVALADVPPGFTHDEADHGLDAWGVVNGIRPLYFTVGYGREPLFDYGTAGLMAFLGPSYLAGRLTAAFFSLIAVAGVYAWARRAFDRRVGLLAAAGLAISFWAVMTGRHALRSVTLPALFLLSAAAFWEGLRGGRRPAFLIAGLLLGASFYSYLPARGLWTLFPGLLFFWALFDRRALRRRTAGTLWMLLVAALVAAPLFLYLTTNPGAELRLSQLSGPLQAALAGDWAPLGRNIVASLRLFTVEGDALWRYNLPGKPWLGPVMGALFYAGLLLAVAGLARPGRSARVFALAWLLLGLAPALITGGEASVTRAIGLQPVLFLFPALALVAAHDWLAPRAGRAARLAPLLPLLLFTATAAGTARDYFVTWANDPQVRVQYETTLVTAIDYLNEQGAGAVALSTATPDLFHSPSTALMTLRNPAVSLRWFNGAHSLLVPGEATSTVIFSGFAPLNPALDDLFLPAGPPTILPLRPDDVDRPLAIYPIRRDDLLGAWAARATPIDASLGDPAAAGADLFGFLLLTPARLPGEALQLATFWRVRRAVPGLVLFTHLTGADGVPLAQADRLDVPGFFWVEGDLFVQLHTFAVPSALSVGRYPLRLGGYTCAATPCEPNPIRLPWSQAGELVGDSLILPQEVIVGASGG